MSNEFSHLHVHSDYSLLDGLGKIGDYVKYGKSLGMKAMAFTDHGTMAGLVTAYDTCKASFSLLFLLFLQKQYDRFLQKEKF